ncbi:biofilm peroxide resistance protein BsmA [Tatumella sp. UBA2305]|uniref:biofilm peroxide resistance protein BsmA n=1 Tax=Tatumella sp. UBA2305 TaxID=1947647 RepID=UPI0025EB12E8|nr:biofilm peroxide resistance protein BsmA [Tatumella sp. UBA2305]
MPLRVLFLFSALLLSSCALVNPTPVPRPPLKPYAQELSLAQTLDLCKTANVHVTVYGSPDDAERTIYAMANQAGVRWYRIIMVSDTVVPGRWYSEAIFYSTQPTTRNVGSTTGGGC